MSSSLVGVGLGLIFSAGVISVYMGLTTNVVAIRVKQILRNQNAIDMPLGISRVTSSSIDSGFFLRLVAWLNRGLGRMWSDESVEQRLLRAGDRRDLIAFRVDQVRWLTAGCIFGAVFASFRAIVASSPLPAVMILLSGVLGFSGAALCDLKLTQSAASRCRDIESQLADVSELLAFLVSAGMSPSAGLARMCNRMKGPLVDELELAVRAIGQGELFGPALQSVGTRIGSRPLQRFIDGIVIATERGTPIASVLRAQALDARSEEHRRLMESAGRKEVLALVPVVFLILPAVVVIAVYPGFYGLTLMV